jgi:histidinol phosphatase-like enzyme
MKIIFLDIDGVLNSDTWYKKRKTDFCIHEEFDPFLVQQLNQLIKDTKAKIVISSSWRKSHTLEEMQKLFKQVGIRAEIIGMTPVLKYANHTMSVPRGCEILKWLQDNEGLLGTQVHNFKNYVILDDDSDMLYWQRNNFFLVDRYVGLTPNLVYRITNFLN